MFENKEKSASVKILELRTGERDTVQQIKYLQNELITSYNQKRLTKRALTLGSMRKSQAVFYALSFFWLDGFAVPTPAQVTQTVGQFLTKYSKTSKRCFYVQKK